MVDDESDDKLDPSVASDIPWWLAAAGVALGVGAAWLARSHSDTMTYEKATRIIRDFDPMHPKAHDRQQMAAAMAFFAREQRKRNGWPINEETDAADRMEAELSWGATSQDRMDAVKQFTAFMAKRMPKPVPNSGPKFVLCPRCQGMQNISLRDYYGHLQSQPCPRCGGRGKVGLGD